MSSPADIGVYWTPWPTGTRCCKYYGPIYVTRVVRGRDPGKWLRARYKLVAALKRKAHKINENATHVVGAEESIDPFARGGVLFHVAGTVAWLEPLEG